MRSKKNYFHFYVKNSDIRNNYYKLLLLGLIWSAQQKIPYKLYFSSIPTYFVVLFGVDIPKYFMK